MRLSLWFAVTGTTHYAGTVDAPAYRSGMATRVPDGSPDDPHKRDAVLSGAQLNAINRFPDDVVEFTRLSSTLSPASS